MTSLRETIPLQKVKIVKKSIGGIWGAFLFFGFLSIFVAAFLWLPEAEDIPEVLDVVRKALGIAWFVFLALLFCWIPVYQYLYYQRYFYDMDEKNIVIRKGVWAQKEITLPFSRITDVYVDQDILDVPFKLYDVHISTPTESSGMFAHIDGINKEGSQQLRQMILDKINQENS